MNINIVTLGGNLTRDPEVRHLQSGMSVCDMALAINSTFKNKAGESTTETCFVEIQTWGKTADVCGEHLRKGAQVVVEGRLQLDKWEKDGEKRSKLRVRADRVHFVGTRATSATAPAQPSSASAGASGSGAGPDDDIPFIRFND